VAHLAIRPHLSAMISQQIVSAQSSVSPSQAARRGPLPLWEKALFVCLIAASAVLQALALAAGAPRAHADSVAYLIDVTVRPGYNFASAADALAYGQQLCDKVSQGRAYADIIGDVKSDFSSSDEFQASDLIDKAVNELCPAVIWQLRNSAAHYRPPAG
jgi:Protein of unknown function (DUF732)